MLTDTKAAIPRIMIAGTGSGCGKTTVSCAIMAALIKRGRKLAAFKCGPDYIDPMFHSRVLGASSTNLDSFLCPADTVKYLFAKNSAEAQLSIIEGVMGFYDGLSGTSTRHSAYELSQLLECRVVLVVNCKGLSLSLAAVIKGYKEFRENRIAAVILNNVSAMSYKMYREIVEKETGLQVLGFLPADIKSTIESRHLGLITAGEIEDLQEKTCRLGELAEAYIDLDALTRLADTAPYFSYSEIRVEKGPAVPIAIAMDEAFCFYYKDSLELLEKMGARLLPFSPLHGDSLPQKARGLILGGGYPELYLKELSGNHSMINSIRKAHKAGMPIYGECGGFLYLGEQLEGESMLGLIPMECKMTDKLQNFGYVKLKPLEETELLPLGSSVPAHEFHYSASNVQKHCLRAEKPSGKAWDAGYSKDGLFALYPHIHFYGAMDMARRFLQCCRDWTSCIEE